MKNRSLREIFLICVLLHLRLSVLFPLTKKVDPVPVALLSPSGIAFKSQILKRVPGTSVSV